MSRHDNEVAESTPNTLSMGELTQDELIEFGKQIDAKMEEEAAMCSYERGIETF